MNLFIDNGNVVRVKGVKDDEGTVVSNATVTLENLADLDGNQVSGATFPVTLAAVSGTPGDYKTTLPATLSVSKKKDYKATIKVVAPGGAVGQQVCTWTAKERTCD